MTRTEKYKDLRENLKKESYRLRSLEDEVKYLEAKAKLYEHLYRSLEVACG